MLFLNIFTIWYLSTQAVTLDQAVLSSLERNETVEQSRAKLKQVEEQKAQATSAILPNISFVASYLIQPPVDDPLAADFFPQRQASASLTAIQPLFRGFREYAAIRRQNRLVAAQRQSYTVQMVQLYQQVAESFMDVLAVEQDIRNVEAQQRIYKDRVKYLDARTRRGESSATESLTAQSTSAALDAEYQLLRARHRSARENFAYLTGLAFDTPLEEGKALNNSTELKPLAHYLARIELRPDIQLTKEQFSVSDEEVSIAKGGHLPTLDVVGNYYLARPQVFLRDLKWDVQFRLSIPLFEGGLRVSQVRESVAKRSEMDLAIAQLRRKSEAEIKSLYESLSLRADQLVALKRSSELAEKNYQYLLRDSRRGLSRNIDVQVGLSDYRFAKRSFDQARYQARLERIRLDLAAAIIPGVLTKDL